MNLCNIDKQRQFLLNSMIIEAPSRQRARKDTAENRSNSIKYYLDMQHVCQPMFLSTFGISRKMICTAISKKQSGNLVSEDARGKGQSNIKYDDTCLESVKQHIKKFPVVESHFCREGTKRQYK